jgi:hypothetical protein
MLDRRHGRVWTAAKRFDDVCSAVISKIVSCEVEPPQTNVGKRFRHRSDKRQRHLA